MGSLNNSVETVNAAATAIVSAESRVQPTSNPRKRWGCWWRLHWCFGSQKRNKKVTHAVLVPESAQPSVPASTTQSTPSNATLVPFIAPPSSPAVLSGPSSVTHSPTGLLSVASLSANVYSPNERSSIFAIGPYTYETQLVSPPVFSTFTTEPSTACFTPPPESVHLTTPSSPEVPFAQLLTSSLERNHRNSRTNHKFAWSPYEYHQYPLSPGAQLTSPGSAIPTSGTSTPFPDKRSMLEAQKILGFDEHFSTRKWGSWLGSGSVTPDGASECSRLGSGSLTPDALGQDSRLVSECSTPTRGGPKGQESCVVENRIFEVPAIAHQGKECQSNPITVHHRVSFELTGEDVARCLASKSIASYANAFESSKDLPAECNVEREGILEDRDNSCDSCSGETCIEVPVKYVAGGKRCRCQHLSVAPGSIKDFNFDNIKAGPSNKPSHGPNLSEARPGSGWSFFPMMQPDTS